MRIALHLRGSQQLKCAKSVDVGQNYTFASLHQNEGELCHVEVRQRHDVETATVVHNFIIKLSDFLGRSVAEIVASLVVISRHYEIFISFAAC